MPAVVTSKNAAIPAGMVDVTPKAAPKPAEAPPPVATDPTPPPTVDTAAPATEAVESPAEDISVSKRAKEAADKARKGAANNRKLMEERGRLEQQAQYQASEAANLRAQLEQTNNFIRTLGQDPVAAMKQLGVPAAEIARRMAEDGSPEAKIGALEQRLQEYRQEIERMQQHAQNEQQAVRRQQLENEYKQEAQNPKRYPNLATVHPDFILSRTKELLIDLRAKGHDPKQFSNHDLLQYLDSAYSKSQAQPAPTEDSEKVEKKTATITNKLQSAKHVAPPDPTKMSDRKWKAWAAEQLRASMGTK